MKSNSIHIPHRLLVVDDNPAIHADFRKILEPAAGAPHVMIDMEQQLFGPVDSRDACSQPFLLSCASSGQEGLALVQSGVAAGKPFAIAFIDVRMPIGWDGIETASRVLQEDPNIQIVMCTAFSDYSWGEMMEKLGQSDRILILKKPFDSIEVLQLAHALGEKWQLGQRAKLHLADLEDTVRRRTEELQNANAQLKLEMEERARAEEALRQSQKMDALGQLAGGVAHDFNNLLTVIRGYAQCLLADPAQGNSALEALSQIDIAAERAANLTSQMLVFSRKKRMHREFLDLNEVITHLNKMLRRLLGEDICLQFQPSGAKLGVKADRAMVEQVIMNLVVNARDAMPSGGSLMIRTDEVVISDPARMTLPAARAGVFACITVIDTGCGISPDALPHLFEPFYTTKEPGKGTGLGLATVYGIVKQHDGWIDVQSRPGRGSTFNVFLPLIAEDRLMTHHHRRTESPAGGDETILLVEDEEALREFAANLLRQSGYRVIPAGSGVEALKIWEQRGHEIDLLLTDMVMPEGISGWSLAQQLQLAKAELKVVYTTGYSLEAVDQEHALAEGANFLSKPYHPIDLISIVRRNLDQRALELAM
ncbi:MAG TPA: response regulator [Verrucomicrobiae bacterium]|nr:response regulator [Verrucomicrobiae bacterium]